MPLSLLLLAPLLAQIGPSVSPGAGGPLPQAPLPERPRAAPVAAPVPPSRLEQCRTLAGTDPLAALDVAEGWGEAARGPEVVDAGECEAIALTRLLRWDEAQTAFASARDHTAANELARRAQLGAMAGNAALGAGDAEAANTLFASAHGDAQTSANPALIADIGTDWSRALVALGRPAEAAALLAAARAGNSPNPLCWLLSATLSRRQGQLAEAQTQIERAAQLAPRDGEIGLEAGVIAVLDGRERAARRSWQSVLLAAPGSEAATTAQGYLDQLGPEPAVTSAVTPAAAPAP
jgi:tetratricopeptide (TPR) repeat protein